MTTPNSPRGHFRVPLSLCAAGIMSLAAFGAAAQPEPKADPHAKLLEKTDPSSKPGTIILPEKSEGNENLDKAIADFGESPFAALYDAAGADARAFAQHNMTLSNPFFEGRVPGSRGNRIAAEYIEYYFKRAGLEPAFGSEEKAADGTPVMTPNTSQMIAAPSASEIVTGARSIRSGSTGFWVTNEYPRQGAGQWSTEMPLLTSRPTMTPCSQCQYCTGTGS